MSVRRRLHGAVVVVCVLLATVLGGCGNAPPPQPVVIPQATGGHPDWSGHAS